MTEAEMSRLVEDLTYDLGIGWRESMEFLRDRNTIERIAEMIANGRIDLAIQGIEEAARSFAADVTNAFNLAAEDARNWLDQEVKDRDIGWDSTNPRAVRAAANTRYDIIREVSNDQRNTVRAVIMRGQASGDNPLTIARDVRDGLGLTDYQESIVYNLRRELQEGDYSSALARRLVNGNSSRSLNAAIAGDRALSQDRIDRIVEQYREDWITYRSETIARTQGMRAAHEGTENLYAQAIEDGVIDPSELEQTWYCGPLVEDSRDGHRLLNNVSIPLGAKWTNPLTGAELRWPGDVDADVSETANCRCRRAVRYKRRNGVPQNFARRRVSGLWIPIAA